MGMTARLIIMRFPCSGSVAIICMTNKAYTLPAHTTRSGLFRATFLLKMRMIATTALKDAQTTAYATNAECMDRFMFFT